MKLAAKILLGYLSAETAACPFTDYVMPMLHKLHDFKHWGQVHLTDDSGDPITHIN